MYILIMQYVIIKFIKDNIVSSLLIYYAQDILQLF